MNERLGVLKRRFKEVRNFLMFHLQDGYLSCMVWIDLQKERAALRNLSEDIRDLFGIHLIAHKNYAFSCIARVIDLHKDAWGLEKFFGIVNNYLIRSGNFDEAHLSALHEEYDRFYADHKVIIDTVRDIRDIYFSHFDKDSVLKQRFNYEKDWPIKAEELHGLFLAVIALINRYSDMIDGNVWDPESVTMQNTVKKVVQNLHED